MPQTKHNRKGKDRSTRTPSPRTRRAMRLMDNIESGRYMDFDAAVAALDPIRFKVRGHTYEIAEDPDASVILKHMRSGTITDPNASGEILESLLGVEIYNQLIENGIGTRQLPLMVNWIMAQFGFEMQQAASEAEQNGAGGDSPNP